MLSFLQKMIAHLLQIHVLQIRVLQIRVLQIRVLQILVLQIRVLQIRVLQIQSSRYFTICPLRGRELHSVTKVNWQSLSGVTFE